MLKRCLFILILFFYQPVFLQADKVDSLKTLLAITQDDSTRLDLMHQITTEWFYSGVARHNDSINHYTLEAIALAKKNASSQLARALLLRGKYLISINNLPDATSIFLESLSLFEKQNDAVGLSGCYLQLGLVSYILQCYDDAIVGFKLSLQYKNDVKQLEATSYYLIAICYSEQNKIKQAEAYFEKAVAIFRSINSNHNLSECYMYLGRMYTRSNNLAEAKEYLDSAAYYHKLSGQDANSRLISFDAELLLQQKNVSKAIAIAEKAMTMAQTEGDELTQLEAANTLYKAYHENKNFDKAYFYLAEVNRLQNTLASYNKTLLIAQMKSKFEYNKKDTEEKVKRERAEQIQIAKLAKQKLIRNFFMAGFILILIAAGVLYKQYRSKQFANMQLSESIENLKNTQTQLVQSEKLASLGQITAGIAHEIKNPLNFVNNFSEITDEMVDELLAADNTSEKRELAKNIKQNLQKISFHGKRVDQVVQSMLLHSHSTSVEKQFTDINKLCDDFASLALKGMQVNRPGFSCEVIKTFDPAVPEINIIPQEVSRVLLNLFANAFYAVWKKSKENGNELSENKYWGQVNLKTVFQHGVVTVLVKDNGVGIPEKIIPKIFEPFFTTKPTGDGSGLGLSICYDIMKGHGGSINVVSRENEFTEFTIQFPVKA